MEVELILTRYFCTNMVGGLTDRQLLPQSIYLQVFRLVIEKIFRKH